MRLRVSVLVLGIMPMLATTAHAAGVDGTRSDDQFCIRVQQMLAGTKLVPVNHLYGDYPSFRASKTSVRPLTTHQHVLHDEAGQPQRLSCKIKTPDHLVAEYGAGSARDTGLSCRDVNRLTARSVYAALGQESPGQIRIPEDRLVFDEDETVYMGVSWVGPYDYAYRAPDGRLHLMAKALRVDWDNVWLSWAPDRLRGAWYCHLVAPEHLRRLALGTASAPTH